MLLKFLGFSVALLITFALQAQQTSPNENKRKVVRNCTIVSQANKQGVIIATFVLPKNTKIEIGKNAVALIKKSYNNSDQFKDSLIGKGRCFKIEDSVYYFEFLWNNGLLPQNNDLIEVIANIKDGGFKMFLYAMANINLTMLSVYGEPFYPVEAPYNFNNANTENDYLKAIIEDIKFTGGEMLKQQPALNMPIKSGLFKNVPLLEAMQKTTTTDLIEFLKYIIARPKIYKGGSFKISEIYATWLEAGSPQVERKDLDWINEPIK